MPGRDTVELFLGGLAGVLLVVVGYGATLGGFDAATVGIAALALLVVVAAAAVRRRRSP